MPPTQLSVSVFTPAVTVFKGKVDSISCRNQLGPFDILPQHANFVSTIEDSITLHIGQEVKQLKIERGIIYCHKNEVKIFAGVPAPRTS